MKKPTKHHLLTQAVLASTFFVGSFAYATQFGTGATPSTPPPTPGPISVAAQADNIVEILGGTAGFAGQIAKADGNAVNLNKLGGTVLVGAQNGFAGVNAILTTGAATQALGVNVTAANGVIVVGPGSGINSTNTKATSDAILVGAAGTSISNFGTVSSSDFSAVHLTAAGTGTTLVNHVGGIIQNTIAGTTPTILVDAAGGGLVLRNEGLINHINNAANAVNAIELHGPFASIDNLPGGILQQVQVGAAAGELILVGAATGTALAPTTITNRAGAKMLVLSPTGDAIQTTGAITGTITNAGLIQVEQGSALSLGANVTGLISNTGNMVSLDSANGTVFATGGAVLSGTFLNAGNIIDQTHKKAVDFSGSSATLVQAGGSIVGDVTLGKLASGNVAGANQNVLTMTGGMINGNVNATTLVGSTNLLTLKGGNILGQVTLGDSGDTINLQGTIVNGAMIGGTGLDTLNLLTSFTNTGIIDQIENINVKSGVFTQNLPIFGLSKALTVNSGARMNLNANISGAAGTLINNGLVVVTGTPTINFPGQAAASFTNNGLLELGNTGVLTINDAAVIGSFVNAAGGNMRIDIGGIRVPEGFATSGQMVVNAVPPGAVTLLAGSVIQPMVHGFTPQGQTFDILSVVGGGGIIDKSTLLPSGSAVVSFTKSINPAANILQLVGQRNSFASLSSTQVTQGVAGTLDVFAQEKGFMSVTLVGQLDQLPTQQAVEEAMESLAPSFNYGLVAGSFEGMNLVFDSVQTRIQDLRAMQFRRIASVASNTPAFQVASNSAAKGLSFGDPANTGSVWIKGLGSYLNQKERDGVAGYKATAEGLAIGGDWGASDCVTVGLAGSFTKANVQDKNINPKDQAIKSWQATAYGWFEFQDGIYLDTMLGIASNDYKSNRVIHVNQIYTAAQADFNGTQFGAQADLGWLAMREGNCYLAPFARLKYMHLDLDDYTESGADFLNLNVQNQDLNTFLGGLGFKTGTAFRANDVVYMPEFTAMIGYDFENDNEQTAAGFLGGGPAFGTDGIKPGRTVLELGLGLDAHVSDNSVLAVKYKLGVRDDFTSNSAYLQYSYLWN